MARAGLDKGTDIRKVVELANEIGIEKITLKILSLQVLIAGRKELESKE